MVDLVAFGEEATELESDRLGDAELFLDVGGGESFFAGLSGDNFDLFTHSVGIDALAAASRFFLGFAV